MALILRGAGLAFVLMPALLGQTHDQTNARVALDRSALSAARAAAVELRFDVPPDHPERWSVVLTGVDARALPARAFVMYAVPTTAALLLSSVPSVPARHESVDLANVPPLAGRYETDGGGMRFFPQFAPVAGVTYIARAAAPPAATIGANTGNTGVVEARFSLSGVAPASLTPATSVTAIYPTSDRVPANLLKLYLEFSAPMSDGEAERRIHLLDAAGREVPGAFLHVDEELWDASRRRLTVLFDPGRVKRGLRAHVEDGAPLVAGRTYRLVVDAAWRDGEGRPLASRIEKRLIVGQADRTSPDWRRWRVQSPMARTRTALVVQFDEPLDRALLDRWLAVTDANGHRVDGVVTVGAHESSWAFTPAQPWSDGRHQLHIDPRLEDRAANSLRWLFDVDLATSSSPPPASDTITLTFTPRGAPAEGT